jgi:hypothetical protein
MLLTTMIMVVLVIGVTTVEELNRTSTTWTPERRVSLFDPQALVHLPPISASDQFDHMRYDAKQHLRAFLNGLRTSGQCDSARPNWIIPAMGRESVARGVLDSD